MCVLLILLTGSVSVGQTLVATAGSMEFTINYKLQGSKEKAEGNSRRRMEMEY
jgi:hypothetical protein